jgi:hypothetical protein
MGALARSGEGRLNAPRRLKEPLTPTLIGARIRNCRALSIVIARLDRATQ